MGEGMRAVLLITVFVVGLTLCPEQANANSGWDINNVAKDANFLKYLGLSVEHSTSNVGTRFVVEYRPTRGITWDPTLVVIPDDKDSGIGVLITKKIKGSEVTQYSFTIAKDKLKNSVFYLHNYQDGVVFVGLNLADIVESSKAISEELPNTGK